MRRSCAVKDDEQRADQKAELTRTSGMEHQIKRGETVIGTIICPSESGASVFGMEVLVISEFGNVDADTQFESFDSANSFLNSLYETRCRMLGIVAEPRAVEPQEVDEEAAYYAREAAREQAEIRSYDEFVEAQNAAPATQPEPLQEAPDLSPVASDDPRDSDDLPF